MKIISFLFSIKTKKFPKRAFLLEDNTVAVIEQEIDEDANTASDKVEKVINDTTVQSATWWWPGGRAFREMNGVPEFAVLNMIKEYGFTLSKTCRLEHQQVDEENPLMDGYMEIKLEVSDEKYSELCQEYGQIKIIS
jgi:hypothetical protein